MKNLIITSFDYYLYSCNDIYIVFDKNNNSKNWWVFDIYIINFYLVNQ